MNLSMKNRPNRPTRARQGGVVLIIALTVLVAMSLAGVALVRSVDNTVVIAGNIAFKQGSLQVADRGANDAVIWLIQTNIANPTLLYDDVEPQGYYSSRPAQEPDWFTDIVWQGALTLNGGLPDQSGNTVKILIHRMCTQPGLGPSVGDNQCGYFYPPTNKQEANSKTIGQAKYEGTPQVYYRVTTRVEGPRNNITVVQTNILI